MGKCRSLEGGTMCPSYRATREELYSTRGRARQFFELLSGEIIRDGWHDHSIKDSLDLCLSCKGCKTDCPTHVDIARYKSEFLAHYHRRHRRSLAKYVIGRIGSWLPHAMWVAPAMNATMSNRAARPIGKHLGLSPDVPFPRIAPTSFRRSATARRIIDATPRAECADVVLWTDTFNNGFSPHVLEAAVSVFERHSLRPYILRRHVCCGRPLYDVGLVDAARTNLLAILDQLDSTLRAFVPVVVLEPSCISVFRDEMPALLPEDERARPLSRHMQTFAEFVVQRGLQLPEIGDTPIVHGHCHQKACGGMSAEARLVNALGRGAVLNTGCCRMAGGYGYGVKTASIGQKIGREDWLPRLGPFVEDQVLIADGFSCRSQAKGLGRAALHLAEWMDLCRA
jgi:Fe-S oxidoreductase